ncbi:unnamed protein product [Closterium sp. Naga37s-1]|nr:unnamed protein product [Closterium sp. Naga37s-1]
MCSAVRNYCSAAHPAHLVNVASLNFLAVFAALPPDGYYEINEPGGLEEAYDARALFEADSEAAVDSVDWVESDNSEDPRILADVAADLKQPSAESDGASGRAKKSTRDGQAGTNARAPVDFAASPNGKAIAARPKKGKQGKRKHCVRRRRGRCVRWAATKHRRTRTTKKTTGDLKTADRASAKPKGAESGVPAVGKQETAPVSTFESTQKKGAAPVSTSGDDSNSGAAPQPRALLEADTDASVESVDSVDFEDPRVLRDVAADLKRSSDDFSGAVKNSLGQAGRNARNSFDKTFHTRHFAPKRKPQRGGKPGKKPGKGNAGSGPKGLGLDLKASVGLGFKIRAPGKKLVKGNGARSPVPKPPVPTAGTPGVSTKLEGVKENLGAATKLPTAPAAAGTPGVPPKLEGAKDNSGGAATQPRVLTEDGDDVENSADWVDSVDSTVDSVDSVDSENARELRTVADVAADVKQSSDDLSGAVKNSVERMGTNLRNSFERMTRPGRFDGVRTKPLTKPGVLPFTKPVTKPGVLPFTKPVTKPGVLPFTKPVTKPGVLPFTKPVTKPGVLPFTKPVTKPGVLPFTKPVTKSGVQPRTKPVTKPRPKPITKSAM